MKNKILVEEESLFFETLGQESNSPVLYIHGAPGIGVLDFVYFQGKKFESNFFLIAPEQRGVWRSQEIEEYNIDKIIKGYEEIRKFLGVKKWNVVTHCFGARIFIEYYRKFPQIFEKVVFENPIITSLEPFENIIPLQLKILKQKNFSDYNKFLKMCNEVETIEELEKFSDKLSRAIKMDTNSFLMGDKTVKELKKLKTLYDYQNSMKSRQTEIMMSKAEILYSKNIDYEIEIPLLILYSLKDVTVSVQSLDSIQRHSTCCKVEIFRDSKHWIHIDEEDRYYEIVSDFFDQKI